MPLMSAVSLYAALFESVRAFVSPAAEEIFTTDAASAVSAACGTNKAVTRHSANAIKNVGFLIFISFTAFTRIKIFIVLLRL